MRPPFCTRVGAVDERLVELQPASLLQVASEGLNDSEPGAVLTPLLETTMSGLVGRVPPRQVVPRRAGSQDPEDRVQDIARVTPRAATTIGAHPRLWQKRFDDGPLLLGQIHRGRRSEVGLFVDPLHAIYETRSSG
jgi:hypothetical protein